ncbi:MAG TPA: enoyl-CoA hydratase/isomerase family protein [Solirubrobacterales bacterium]|nr:enoyl-CoA hydratase/isomerase family protein [Solirubrobacterales bacterium]
MTLVERRLEEGVLALTLNRPEKLNALSPALVAELLAELSSAEDDEVRVVVLLGAGRSFCAGADVAESLGLEDLDAAARFLAALADVFRRVSALPKPVIAALQGHAVGGGAELALEADLRIAAEDARLSFPDVALGSTPATLYQLVRLAGRSRALEMALLGTEMGAGEMERLGLVHRVVAADALEEEALALARRLRDRASARSLRFAKEAGMHAEQSSREADLRANVAAMLACHLSEEQRAFVRDFGNAQQCKN